MLQMGHLRSSSNSFSVVCWISDYLKFAMRVCGIMISSAVSYLLTTCLTCNNMEQQAQDTDNSGELYKQEGPQMRKLSLFSPIFSEFFHFVNQQHGQNLSFLCMSASFELYSIVEAIKIFRFSQESTFSPISLYNLLYKLQINSSFEDNFQFQNEFKVLENCTTTNFPFQVLVCALCNMLGAFDKQCFHRYIALFKVFCHTFLYVSFPTLLCLLPQGIVCILLTQTNRVMLFCLAVYFRYEVVYGNSTFYSKEFLGTLPKRDLKIPHAWLKYYHIPVNIIITK